MSAILMTSHVCQLQIYGMIAEWLIRLHGKGPGHTNFRFVDFRLVVEGLSGRGLVVGNGFALKAIQRCMLMTTDPGDLVLDITCGSGTTAYVAEQLNVNNLAPSGID